ncbi:tRNA pseudouridine(13) synthase TruD, partial [Candidatus Woesearchaeota archaeon]|nr:tRNA pseudouridine(13) synthase TruD [Candidatus Woesearchaeota archaeon]
KYLIKRDYEMAVKQYFMNLRFINNKSKDNDKKNILRTWPTFNIKVNDYEFKKIINEYKNTKSWIKTYQKIPSYLRQMFIIAYQSYLWNECVKLLIKEKVGKDNIEVIPYSIDELYFSKIQIKDIPKTFQTISQKISSKIHESKIIQKVLDEEKISIPEFKIYKSGNFFKTHEREVIIYPKDFELMKPIKDGLTYSIVAKFTLPKGSYATIVMKRLFGK